MKDGDGSNIGKMKRSKVATLIEKHDLEGMGSELEQRWTAEGDDRWSLRDLADFFNQQLLEAVFDAADIQTYEGNVPNIYERLTREDVAEADRMRIMRQLERDGLDVEEIGNEFVSYQAIRSYLKEYRGVDYAETEVDRDGVEKTHIQRLRGRTAAVTKGKLEQLRKRGELGIGNFRVLVDVHAVCEECGRQHEVSELIDTGQCDCFAGE